MCFTYQYAVYIVTINWYNNIIIGISPTPEIYIQVMYICVDFIQGACNESLDSHVQGAPDQPPHPWSLWLVNHFS